MWVHFVLLQDTVVGLEALSEFAKMSSDSVDIDATIQSSDFTQRFQINDDNAMVSQSVMVMLYSTILLMSNSPTSLRHMVRLNKLHIFLP